MKIISHRGNLSGPSYLENNPNHIQFTISLGFDVEVDVRCENEKFFLGHDYSQYEISEEFLKNPKLWCHAKTFESLKKLLKLDVNCFYHTIEDYVITSRKYIWTVNNEPGVILVDKSAKVSSLYERCLGICTDYPVQYKESYENLHPEFFKS